MDERTVIQNCLTEAKKRLDYWREQENELQVSLIEADINHMLERLSDLD